MKSKPKRTPQACDYDAEMYRMNGLRNLVALVLVTLVLSNNGPLSAQNRPSKKTSRRGLEVKKSQVPETAASNTSLPQSGDDRPQLVVQLGNGGAPAAYSSDGRFIVTCGDDAVLWDTATAQEIRRFVGHRAVSAIFSPDGRFVLTAGSLDKTARIWDSATGREVRRIATPGEVRWAEYSPDGQFILTTGNRLVILWDAATGRRVRQLVGHTNYVDQGKFSTDGRFILTGSTDHTAILWDASTGVAVRRFTHGATNYESITSVAYSRDGGYVLTGGGLSKTVKLWEAASGKLVRTFVTVNWIDSVDFSPDGQTILIGGYNNTREDESPGLWNVSTGQELRRFSGHEIGGVRSVSFSPDGRFVLTGGRDGTARTWESATGKELRRFDGYASTVNSVVCSPDGKFIAATSSDFTTRLWDTASGREARRFRGHTTTVDAISFSSDARYAVTGTRLGPGVEDNSARIWDVSTGEEVRRFVYGDPRFVSVGLVAYAPNGKTIFTSMQDMMGRDTPAVLWDIATGREIRRFTGHQGAASSIAYSPDSRFVLTAGLDQTTILWDIATGQEVRRFKRPDASDIGTPTYVSVLPDGSQLATASSRTLYLWDMTNGALIRRLTAPDIISSLGFAPDGRIIILGGEGWTQLVEAVTGREIRRFQGQAWVHSASLSLDGKFLFLNGGQTIVVSSISTGREICRLISLKDESWVVVTPEGRFDASDLEGIKGLHWVMPDDPFKALPLEVFMRDYYEPRLLPRLLAGESFKPLRALADLNRAQPIVAITGFKQAPAAPNTVSVTVEVSGTKGEFQRSGKKVALESGVYDLQLFRDGQLVAYAPKNGGEVRLEQERKVVFTFDGIKLPRRADLKQVEFSAYAFNSDRVKSATDRKVMHIVRPPVQARGRAYLISVGVNAYEQADFDLSFAANDARRLQQIFADKLPSTGEYDEIVQVPLISDYEMRGGRRVITEELATKANVKAVFDLLSGKAVAPEIARRIPNADKLREATPDDMVLVSFSSHGFADDNGDFYFVPYDTGTVTEHAVTPAMITRCISSDELSQWLRDVDAGEMVMIADACHSAATVDTAGFKPGPMGSRGLGQLAYNKRMRILTSTQADDVALESELIKQGLLTYALTHDGIEADQADFKPKDRTITLAEWLEYGVKRVPVLYEEVRRGDLQTFGRAANKRALIMIAPGENNSLTKTKTIQQPSLFDFGKRKREVVLVKARS